MIAPIRSSSSSPQSSSKRKTMSMPSLKKKSGSSSSGNNNRGGKHERPATPPLHTSSRSNNNKGSNVKSSSKSSSSGSAMRSGRFSTSSRSRSNSNSPSSSTNVDDNTNNNNNGGEDDPLMTLFRVHHNNRVQFDLDTSKSTGNTDQTSKKKSSSAQNSNTDTTSKFNIKKFVQTSIFTNTQQQQQSQNKPLLSKNKDGSFNSSYIDDDDDDDVENTFIKKMLVPSAPRRLSSFLKSRGGSSSHNNTNGTSNNSNSSSSGSGNPSKGDIDKLEDQFLLSSNQFSKQSTSSSSSSKQSSPKFTYSNLNKHSNNNNNNTLSSSASNNNNNKSNTPTQKTKQQIAQNLKKAQRSHKRHFRYRRALKYYLLALKTMNTAGYADTHPLVTKVLKSLNDVHHAQTVLGNSANIVRMGIQHEDLYQSGTNSGSGGGPNALVKALKLYTIAYRMRRDALGVNHPSLPVLLNMMGSVQVKRGEYKEAMQIYHLALKGRPDENGGRGRNVEVFRRENALTTSVTLRDMGMILEHGGDEVGALRFYHSSLRYSVRFRSETRNGLGNVGGGSGEELEEEEVGSMTGSSNLSVDSGSEKEDGQLEPSSSKEDEFGFLDQFMYSTDSGDNENSSGSPQLELDDEQPFSLDEVRMAKTTTMVGKAENEAFNPFSTDDASGSSGAIGTSISEEENGEMELFFEKRFDKLAMSDAPTSPNDGSTKKFYYDELFVKSSSSSSSPNVGKKGATSSESTPTASSSSQKWGGADVDIAMTLHQIGQIHRRSLRYAAALSAYNASLRGMKEVFGNQHANIAAILGNIGNLYMEIDDYDEAYQIYQEVLGIETLHLGLSHPEVAVTLHNIATIECSRGNFSEGVSLYKQVVDMQKIRFGPQHITVAVTLSCLADANEKLGNVSGAIQTYEEALNIRKVVLGKSHIDVGRILHKLGRLAASRNDYHFANQYIKKAAENYADNKLKSDHPFLREMARDMADIQAGLAFAGSKGFEV